MSINATEENINAIRDPTKINCFKCQKVGNMANDCTENETKGSKSVQCLYCGGQHFMKDC